MRRWRTWLTLSLMVISLGFLTAADIECEDDEFEFNWPNFGRDYDRCYDDCGGWFYYEEYDCGPWCWF
ncbi:MAG TPA: hypothetical protein VLM89_03290 [Phycisphaerae bacterium]|nr:hypothetical protein [Phycisphaerae bacterium]